MHTYMDRAAYRSTFNFPRQESGTKVCFKCKIEQTVDNFYANKYNRDGLKSECKLCFNKEINDRKNADPVGRLFKSAKGSAKNRGIQFELEKKDILIPLKCPILDIDLYFNNKMGGNSPSIDRIDSNLGYTKDNIVICSWRANHIKGDATVNEMFLIYKNWLSKLNINDEILLLPNHQAYLGRILIHCRERCNDRNIIFDLSKTDLKVPRLCPIWVLN